MNKYFGPSILLFILLCEVLSFYVDRRKKKRGSKDILYIYYTYNPLSNYTQFIYNLGYIYYIYIRLANARKKKRVNRSFVLDL
jgi:preprotein translocase subunit YajC